MGIRKKLADAAVTGFGWAAGQAAFDRAKKELFGDEDAKEEAPPDPAEQARLEKEAARRAKQEEKQRAKDVEERRKAEKKLEEDVDRELEELKKRLGK